MNEAAMNSFMEGDSTVVKNIGCMRKVSEMELVVLCNLAHLACLLRFSELDGYIGQKAKIETERFIDDLTRMFTNKTNAEGLHRLIHACTAILGQERLGRYLLKNGELEQ